MSASSVASGGFPAIRECDWVARQTLAEMGNQLALIGVTAVRHDDGAGLVARGLAASLAAHYKVRTLLVTLEDTEQAHDRAPGLIEVLAGEAHLDHAIARPASLPFAILGRGAAPYSLSKLLAFPGVDSCCAAMAEAFDVVVFDCPPPDAGAEVLLLARSLTNLYLVMRSGQVTLKEADQTRNLLENAGARISGAVLTDVPNRRRR